MKIYRVDMTLWIAARTKDEARQRAYAIVGDAFDAETDAQAAEKNPRWRRAHRLRDWAVVRVTRYTAGES